MRRLHVWLGWLVGIPLLFWTVSGLWMVARPIEEVRGTALRREMPALTLAGGVVVPTTARPLRSLTIEARVDGPVWVARFSDGVVARADVASGTWLPPIDRATAMRIAVATYRPSSRVVAVAATSATAPPIDLRQPRPAWQVSFEDGTRLYVDRDSGAVLALRTRQWRAFDWMWGLHIMDLRDREDSSHPILIGFAALAALSIALALILLPLARRRRR